MMGRTPTKEEKDWMSRVAELGCIVCRNNGYETPAEIHHLDGSRKPGAHYKTIGLCFLHHNAHIDSPDVTSRHPYKARFEERYGNEWELWKQTKELIYE